MSARSCFCALAYVACLASASGCVCAGHYGRGHVGGEVAARTGHSLGPRKPAGNVAIPDLVSWENGLSEEEAVAVGLWNHPGYQELLADLEITRADVIQAAELRNPQLSTLFPLGPKEWEFALSVPLDVLWLRPLRVASAQLESARVAERLAQDGLDVVREVRLAYVDWQLAGQQSELAEQSSRLRAEIARIAEAKLKAGDVAELDVSAIRLDALFARGEAARAARNAELARERLRYVLGIELSTFSLTPSPAPAPPFVDLHVEDLVREAVASRPDLRAVQLAVGAAEQRAAVARRDVFQAAAILPDLNSRGAKGFEAGPGVQLTLPIFHRNQGAVARAEAEAERLRRQYVRLRDTAALDVRQAHTRLLQAREDLAMWRDRAVPQAEAAVASARHALEEDGVALLLVLETTRQLFTARGRELEAAAQVRRAVAELERGVGRRLYAVDALQKEEVEAVPVPDPEARRTVP